MARGFMNNIRVSASTWKNPNRALKPIIVVH